MIQLVDRVSQAVLPGFNFSYTITNHSTSLKIWVGKHDS